MDVKKNVEKLFTPKELKTLEIDVEKKRFLINGEEFGDGCTEFTIYCTPSNWHISVEIHTAIHFHTDYDSNGKLLESHRYEKQERQVQKEKDSCK